MPPALTIVMLGPDGLKDAYSVLLQSVRKVDDFYYANGLAALREISAVLVPDLIILHVARSKMTCKPGQIPMGELEQILGDWPEAISIALVDDPRMRKEVEDRGVDLGLLEGVSPTRLLQSIEALLTERQRGQNHSAT
jgi:hypothetical protein